MFQNLGFSIHVVILRKYPDWKSNIGPDGVREAE